MANIGVILAGAASKGAYEIGCMRAIEEYFGMESIKCISSASSGSLVAQAHGRGKTDEMAQLWKSIDPKRYGRFFLTFAGNKDVLQMIDNFVSDEDRMQYEHYVSLWNYTQKKVEYVPFHELSGDRLRSYLHAAIAIPFCTKGEVIDGDLILDGAFLDNIPVYPLLDKDLDYVFCVYFDNYRYFLENEEFDKKCIKLYDFPNEKMLETMTFKPELFDDMEQYGYEYTLRTIHELFAADGRDAVYDAIAEREKASKSVYKPRLSTDTVLHNINVWTKRYSKRTTNCVKQATE